MSRFLIPAVALAALFAVTASTVHAGPFEKAGLKADTGRKLSDTEADKVRGGFRGGNMTAILEALGIDSSLSREEIRTQLRGLGRDAIRSAMADAGIERPTAGTHQRPEGWTPPEGLDRSRLGRRSGARARAGRMSRR